MFRSHLLSKKFKRDERGNVAMMFAVSLVPMIAAAGTAIDYGRVSTSQTRIHAALDSAVLAVAKDPTISLDLNTPAGLQTQAKIQTFFAANLADNNLVSTPNVSLRPSTADRVLVEATGCVKMAFASFTGMIDPCVKARSEVIRGGNVKMEVAIAMDNSGSMDNGKIDAAKEAAVDFVNTLLNAAKTPDQVKISLVPFTNAVNTGLPRTNAGVDSTGLSPIHWENLTTNGLKPTGISSRLTLFDQLGETWGGCMETRPGNYGVNDDAPTTSVPSSLFVPYFAPDEPGDRLGNTTNSNQFNVYANTINENTYGSGDSQYLITNSYLNDDGGSANTHASNAKENGTTHSACSGVGAFALPYTSSTSGWQSKNFLYRSTTNICRYNLAGTSGGSSNRNTIGQKSLWGSDFPVGPNFLCIKAPVQTLTNSKSDLTTAIGKMTNLGGTNILDGFMWAWRTLSPNAPYANGRAYNWTDTQYKNRKIIVLMTDGDNQWVSAANPNGSAYSTNGYYRNNRIATGLSTMTQAKTAMDSKTLEACNNAKAKLNAYNTEAITIYTIGFSASTPGSTPITAEGETLLRNCASVVGGQKLYYKATTAAELKSVFATIAADLSKLRLSQ